MGSRSSSRTNDPRVYRMRLRLPRVLREKANIPGFFEEVSFTGFRGTTHWWGHQVVKEERKVRCSQLSLEVFARKKTRKSSACSFGLEQWTSVFGRRVKLGGLVGLTNTSFSNELVGRSRKAKRGPWGMSAVSDRLTRSRHVKLDWVRPWQM
ncbi:unnamed protein product, partial [Hapterophycus canaliculatus]